MLHMSISQEEDEDELIGLFGIEPNADLRGFVLYGE
jgi:hypothetical protein